MSIKQIDKIKKEIMIMIMIDDFNDYSKTTNKYNK